MQPVEHSRLPLGSPNVSPLTLFMGSFEIKTTDKSDKGAGDNDGGVGLGRATDDEADEEQHVAANDEPSPSEQIRVRAADPAKIGQYRMLASKDRNPLWARVVRRT